MTFFLTYYPITSLLMLRDYLKLHFIVLLWGFTAILGRLLTLPPVELVGWRTGLAALGLGGLLLARRRPAGAGSPAAAAQLLGTGGLVAAHWITFFLAARLSSVSICLAGLATLALWTSLLEPLLLRRPVRAYEIGLGLVSLLGLGLVATTLVSPAHPAAAPSTQLLGLGVAVLSAGLSAVFSIINSRLVRRHEPLVLTLWEMGGAFLSVVLFLPVYSRFFTAGTGLHLALGFNGFAPPWQWVGDWLWLALLAGACTVYAFATSVELMRRLAPFAVNLTINLEPVYGIVLAVLIFGEKERMAGGFYLGTGLIVLSVLLHPVVERRMRSREARAAQPVV
ncbi:MAG: DMT family transporter [Janthinobacterium lividum]